VRVSDLPTVLERLADPDFLDRVVRDPKQALAGYRLTRDDVSVLAARLADEQEVLGFVEQRVAKAGMFSLLSSALPPEAVEGDDGSGADDSPADGGADHRSS
jgi:hypothetical protein